MHNFLYSLTICLLHYYPRHVSSINMPIFRRKNCIHTASGIFAVCKRLHSTLVERCFPPFCPTPRSGFYTMPFQMGFVVDIMVLGRVLLRVGLLRFSHFRHHYTIAPQILLVHSRCHQHLCNLANWQLCWTLQLTAELCQYRSTCVSIRGLLIGSLLSPERSKALCVRSISCLRRLPLIDVVSLQASPL